MRYISTFCSTVLCITVYLILPLSSSIHAATPWDDGFSEAVSIRSKATVFMAGDKEYSFGEIQQNATELPFIPLNDVKENVGFSNHNYWLRFTLENTTSEQVDYYLETGRPITDVVNLYLVEEDGKVNVQWNGDKIPFQQKAVQHRKSVFDITLQPKEKVEAYIHMKSDGEVVMLPLNLYPKDTFFFLTYKEQVFFGFFYGILILACIIYLFFFFALKDKAFIYYGLYVLFIAMLQFSLDGFFHQYFAPQGGWLSDRAVLLSAFISLFFFGRYGDTFLDLKQHSGFLHKSNKILSIAIGLGILVLALVPDLMAYCYPFANAVGILVLVHMIASLIVVKSKKMPVDNYFVAGISFLVLGFVVFILNNFNTIENSFITDNGAKFGIGLEIIFLSISMSNRIRNLRMENEKNQLLALQRAEDMNEIKSSFLSNISHELRTPLNLIMGVASSLQKNKKDEDLDEKCKLILSSSTNLLGYIEDILDFTVIEKGNQELKEVSFDLQSTLARVALTNEKKAEAKNLLFNCNINDSLPKRIIGDKGKLVQILNHLLDNAIKFTNTGQVDFEVDVKQNRKNRIVLDFLIKDTGIGISKEKMTTVYESFTKKSFMDKREFSGLGLGLYIVKTYVDLQGGTIDIKNNQHSGTTCKVSLEFNVDEDELLLEQTQTSLGKDQSLPESKVLLVEDNKMNQTVVKLLFKKWKQVQLDIANNGKEALELTKKHDFDLILMDLQMPIMDGFETTSTIRSGKSVCPSDIPIIVLTADNTSKTRKEIFRLGANDLMTKPINGDLLFTKVQKNIKVVALQA